MPLKRIIVQTNPIISEKKIACLILLRTELISLSLYFFAITGSKGYEIAIVKKEGRSINGIAYPDKIPYSLIIKSLL